MHCLISVIKCSIFEDLVDEYAPNPNTKGCHMFQDADSFVVDSKDDFNVLPKSGFCAFAHKALESTIDYIFSGKSLEGWSKQGNIAIISCPDGIHPVVFKVEVLEYN